MAGVTPAHPDTPGVNGLQTFTPAGLAQQQQQAAAAAGGRVNYPDGSYSIGTAHYYPQGAAGGSFSSGPVNGGQYSGLLNDVLAQIRGYDPSGQINQAFDAQNSLALKQVGLNVEAQQAGRGLAPGDPAGRGLNARLTSEALAPLAAARATALAGAGQGKLQMLAGLLPGLQQADQMAQASYWKNLDWQNQQQDRQQQLADDAQRRQWALEDRKYMVDQRTKAQQDAQQARNSGPVSLGYSSTPHYASSPAPSMSMVPAGSAAAARTGGGYAAPINAPGSPGTYNFFDGFGQSYYGPLGRGGAENLVDAQQRRAEIYAAGNGYGSQPGPVNGTPLGIGLGSDAGFVGAGKGPVSYSPAAAPIAGGAQLVFAPPMSGISVAGPLSTDPMLQPGNSPYSIFTGDPYAYGMYL